jgi:hypothetical protein
VVLDGTEPCVGLVGGARNLAQDVGAADQVVAGERLCRLEPTRQPLFALGEDEQIALAPEVD